MALLCTNSIFASNYFILNTKLVLNVDIVVTIKSTVKSIVKGTVKSLSEKYLFYSHCTGRSLNKNNFTY